MLFSFFLEENNARARARGHVNLSTAKLYRELKLVSRATYTSQKKVENKANKISAANLNGWKFQRTRGSLLLGVISRGVILIYYLARAGIVCRPSKSSRALERGQRRRGEVESERERKKRHNVGL